MRRTGISLLALAAMVLAALVFAAPGSSYQGNTMLTLNADPTTFYYGESTSLSGSLTDIRAVDPVGVADAYIGIQDSENVPVTWATTNSSGDYTVPYRPEAAGSPTLHAYYDGSTYDGLDAAYSDQAGLTVDLAPTQTSITNTPPTTLTLGDSLSIDYRVESTYGIDGNATGGSVSIDETSGLGTLGCDATELSSVTQTETGFAATGTLICTPSATGSYSYHLDYGGETNYQGSDSGTDLAVTVVPPLYDQNNNPLDLASVLEFYPSSTTVSGFIRAADDFYVPTPVSWHITSVFAAGADTLGLTSVIVRVYSDSSGSPGDQVYTVTVPSGSFTDSAGAFAGDGYDGGNLTIPVDVTLTPGHYWLSVQSSGKHWFWQIRGVVSNTAAEVDAPGSCSDWADLASCWGSGTAGTLDFMWMLGGSVVKAAQAALSVTGPASATYGAPDATIETNGGSGTGAVTFSAGSSTACSLADGKLHVTSGTGTCAITATKAGDADYLEATSAQYTVGINKADQAILSVTGPASATWGTEDVAITYTGGSTGGTVTFSAAASSTACSIVDGKLHVTDGSGTCTITAEMAGNDNYNLATSDGYPVTINTSYLGTPGTKTCVRNTVNREGDEHGSLKAAATAHGFANQTGLRKDIQSYCKLWI